MELPNSITDVSDYETDSYKKSSFIINKSSKKTSIPDLRDLHQERMVARSLKKEFELINTNTQNHAYNKRKVLLLIILFFLLVKIIRESNKKVQNLLKN